jgi:Cu(I)-responsive transcriptional regulator
MPTRTASVELAAARERGYYSIGRAAEISGVNARMIRHYESLGLIPRAMRTTADYRVYSEADLHTLRFVRRARNLGFSIEEIAGLLALWRDRRRASADVRKLAAQRIADLDWKIEQLESMRATLAKLATRCHGDDRPECPILDDLCGLPPSA